MDIYKKLLKIKKPVLIEVCHKHCSALDRYRILYPSGYCEYVNINSAIITESFNESCFIPYVLSLEETIKNMKDHDKEESFSIIKIQEI